MKISGTKNNISQTKIILVLYIHISGTNDNFSGTKNWYYL